MATRKIFIATASIAAFISLGAWALLRGNSDPQYRTAPVTRGNVAYAVSATGSPNAVVTVQVGSQVSGNIIALFADFNTKVTKDQVVARIDPQIFQARVDQAKAALSAEQAAVVAGQAGIEKARTDVAGAQATVADQRANIVRAQSAVNDAKVKLGRRVELFKDGVLAQEDLDTAQATYDQAVASADAANAQLTASQQAVASAQAQVRVAETQLSSAQAQVNQAQANLVQAQADLDHTYIRAPVDGVVVARNIDVGQTVAASLQAPTLFQIAQDLTKMQVDTNVSEADVGRVQVGMPTAFTVDAYPNQVFKGSVTAIRKAAINVQNVVTYDVVIGVANPDLKLFPGMTANVKILVDEHDNVLRVPNAALRYARGNAVSVLDGKDAVRRVPVKLGITDGTYTEIAGGDLKEGDPVIIAEFSKKGAASTPAATSTPFGGGAPAGGGGGGGRRGGF